MGPVAVMGPDVSCAHGDVDWRRVREAGAAFAVARASGPGAIPDPAFAAARWAGMQAAGLVRGALLEMAPGEDPERGARAHAAAVRDAGGRSAGDLPPVLKTRPEGRLTPAETLAWTGAAVAAVARETGATPLLMIPASWWIDVLGDPAVSFGCPLWLADPGADPPRLPRAWAAWSFWRFSGAGRLAGIGVPCGLSRMRDAGGPARMSR